MVVLAVTAIFMTAAAHQWSVLVQREREKELIFRGTSIAKGIQDFQGTVNRPPTSLEEMTKSVNGRPPALRQVYDDPMTARYDKDGRLVQGTGQWALIGAGAGVQATHPHPSSGSGPSGGSTQDGSDTASGATGTGGITRGGSTRPPPMLQGVQGVRSTSEDLSIGTYQNSQPGTAYSAWKFQPPHPNARNLNVFEGDVDLPYPPGFGGRRAPGGTPFGGPPGGGAPGASHHVR